MSGKRPPISGEDRLIERFFRPLAKDPAALDLMDDAALIKPSAGADLVLTADALVAGVHFFPDDPADAIARKALRVNLSDLAAKGAEPMGALLSLALPENTGEGWLEAFARGLGEDCALYRCPLLGGDTTKTPGLLTISITALGQVPSGKMVRRKGARAGDTVVVTGTIGDAALALLLRREAKPSVFAQLDGKAKAHLIERYLLPQPRLALALALREYATAAIDVSDGLAGDLMKLAAASGCGARIEVKRVPFSTAARTVLAAEPSLIETALTGGDDYEIVATVPADRLASLQAAAKGAGVELTAIGRIEAGEGVEVIAEDGRPLALARPSFSHF
jgi:thiamine-monophosphate kinase